MREWRHHIHQNPEIAYEEKNTSDFFPNGHQPLEWVLHETVY